MKAGSRAEVEETLPSRASPHADFLYLMAANASNAVFGFLLWTASARLHEPKETGLAADHPCGMSADDYVQVLVPDIKGRRRTSGAIRV
ncbi:MAG: hypothetical protein QME77_02555 [bacterium]|nr:hypothetical protein [bacterium]